MKNKVYNEVYEAYMLAWWHNGRPSWHMVLRSGTHDEYGNRLEGELFTYFLSYRTIT